MSTNFFDNDDEFRDQPEEVSGKTPIEILQQQTPGPTGPRRAPATPPVQAQANVQEEEYEEENYDVTEELEDEEDDYSAVLSDARLRLQQGSLYEIIMNHELFEGMDFDPAAVKHVQRQIRKFAKEQMEIMLGMRKETAKVERLEIDFPFNAVEVRVLKMVADKASGGASKESDKYVPSVTRTTEEVPVIQSPKKVGLNPIVGKKPAPKQAAPAPQPLAKKSALRQTPAAPIQRKAKSNTPDQIVIDGEVITKEMIDSTFEPEYKPLEKPIEKMSTDELLQRNKEASSRRQKQVKNPASLPMPSYEQEAMLHQTRILETSGGNNAVAVIMAAMNNNKK